MGVSEAEDYGGGTPDPKVVSLKPLRISRISFIKGFSLSTFFLSGSLCKIFNF